MKVESLQTINETGIDYRSRSRITQRFAHDIINRTRARPFSENDKEQRVILKADKVQQ